MTTRRCGDPQGKLPHCAFAICEITYLAPDRYYCERDGAYLDTEAKREGLRDWKLRPCRYGLSAAKTPGNGTESGND